MTVIRTSTPASALMKQFLTRAVTPAMIADLPECQILSFARDGFVTGTSAVSELANIKTSANAFTQSNALYQPQMAADTDMGHDVLEMQSNDRYMRWTGTPDFASPWSMLCVAKLNVPTAGTMSVMGYESSIPAERASLQFTATERLRVMVGGTPINLPGATIVAGQWYGVICAYDGSATAKIWGPTRGFASIAVATAPTAVPSLNLSNAGSFGFVGRVDMAGFFNVDLFNATYADQLAQVQAMLQTQYGSVLDGQS